MLIDFFYTLRAAKLKVSVKEYLTLLEALKAGVIGPSVDDFYYLARTALVKDEAQFDKFDRAFAAYFKGVEMLADFTQEEQMELFWRLAPAFELHEVPAAVLRPLYRRLPRTFFVEEGRVTRTSSGLAAEIVSAADPAQRKTDDPKP